METNTISPKIKSFSWGEIKTDNNRYKDAKLFPGGSSEWDWNETGTKHVPGIQPVDVKELLDHNPEVVILSKGVNERLQTMDKTVEYLQDAGCDYFILQTEKAVKKYNDLCSNKRVAALIHSTC